MNVTLDAVLTRLRTSKGLSQLQVAEKLCEVSGMATVTRHEVSRWERRERTPSEFWLGWLARVLEVPVGDLEGARIRAKPGPRPASASGKASTPPRRSTTAAGPGNSAVVSLEYKHRATSVQLKGTYEEPSQAAAVIELFPMMVAPGATGLHVEQQRASGAPRTASGSSATGRHRGHVGCGASRGDGSGSCPAAGSGTGQRGADRLRRLAGADGHPLHQRPRHAAPAGERKHCRQHPTSQGPPVRTRTV